MVNAAAVVTSYRLRRRLIAALALLVSIVVLCGAGAIAAGAIYRKNLATAHRFDDAARKAASIGILAREQYIHEAHTIIVGDRTHVQHHDAWVAEFERQISGFPSDLGGEQAQLLVRIAQESKALARIFAEEIVPAVTGNDEAVTWDAHSRALALIQKMADHDDAVGASFVAQAEEEALAKVFDDVLVPAIIGKDESALRDAHVRAMALVEEMTENSDALEKHFATRAQVAERDADRAASVIVPLSIASCAFAGLFALFVARNLWNAFQSPLAKVRRVAERISAGDHEARVGPIEAEELAVVGGAFNAMLDALAAQRVQLLANERLAAVGRVAAGVAHEINNPIAVIRGYVKTMRKEASTEAVKKELGILDEEAAACQRIAEDLLSYTRAPALFREDVQIVSLVQECVERCGTGPRGLETPMRVDVVPARLRLDPVRMKQVLANLLRNASQANVGSGVIDIEGREGSRSYRLSIADRGPGLSTEARDRLFEPFFTTRRDGVGLGLAVCYGLVTAHGGTISANDRAGGGLEVTLELPFETPAP